MTHSDSIRYLSLALLILSACAPAPEGALDASTFSVSAVGPSEIEQRLVNPSDDYARETTIWLEACVRDVGYLKPVPFQSFRISGAEVSATTDDNGCLRWKETVPYNHLAPESFITLERGLEASSPHRGTEKLRIAVNPWRRDRSSVIDLRYGASPARVSSSALSLVGPDAAKLTLTGLRVQLLSDRATDEGSELDLLLRLSPEYLRQSLDGSPIREAVRLGRFKVSFAIIEKTASGSLLPLSSIENEVAMSDGELTLRGTLSFSRAPAKTSTLEAVLRLEPVDAAGLSSFEGSGKLASLHFNGSVELTPLETPFAELLGVTNAVPPSEASDRAPVCGAISDRFGFYFADWAVEHGGVLSVTRNEGIPNQVAAALRVCLRNRLDDRPVAGHPFDVRLGQSRGSSLVSDQDGCLSWQEGVKFDPFAAEQWLERTIEVRSAQAPFEGIARTLTVQINPWQQGNLFSWDCRKGPTPKVTQAQRARLELQDFSYAFLGQSFEVNRDLNLTVKRTYQLRLDPMIRRQGAGQSGPAYESVGEGRYRLKFLLLASSGENSAETVSSTKSILARYKYLASHETEVQAKRGTIVQEIMLPVDFAELPMLIGRNQVFIELSPIDGRNGLRPVTVTGAFMAMSNSGNATVTSSPQSLAELTGKFASTQAQVSELVTLGKAAKLRARAPKGSVIERFRATTGARAPSPEELKKAGILAADIDALVASATPSKLCKLLPKGARCEPILQLRHVESVAKRPELLAVRVNSVSVNVSMNRNTSESSSFSHGSGESDNVNFGVNAKVGGNLGIFDVGMSANYTHGYNRFTSKSVAVSSGHSTSLSTAVGKTLSAEELQFSLETEIRTCALIQSRKAGVAPLHLCSTKTRAERSTESWYYISQSFVHDSTPLRDAMNSEMRPWITVIRGEKRFENFRSLLEDRTKAVSLEPDQQFERQSRGIKDDYDRFVSTTPRFADAAMPGLLD
ncbi:MAG: hypothetical protein NDJ90_05420 [Oligoflexia bacterium]|nr:hypothetical protein [Oligoflexia bacterium]